MDGWVKLHRQALANDWLSNPNLWAFWCYCLIRANHTTTTYKIGFQDIILLPGQFIFGRNEASKQLKMSVQTIRTCIDSLRKRQNLTIKTTNKFSIFTVVNWDTYQSKETTTNQQINQQLTNNQPTTNQPLTTDKNVKKEKNKPITTKLDASRIKWDLETNVFIHWWAYCYETVMQRPYVITWNKDPMFAQMVIEKTGGMKNAILAGCQLLKDEWHKTKTLSSLSNGYLNARSKIEDRSATIAAWQADGLLPPQSTGMKQWLTEKINGADNQQ